MNTKKLEQRPIIIPKITIIIPSREIILKTRAFEYPMALKIAKSRSLFSKLLASPVNILNTAISMIIIDNSLKLLEPNPNIADSLVISKAGLAACN